MTITKSLNILISRHLINKCDQLSYQAKSCFQVYIIMRKGYVGILTNCISKGYFIISWKCLLISRKLLVFFKSQEKMHVTILSQSYWYACSINKSFLLKYYNTPQKNAIGLKFSFITCNPTLIHVKALFDHIQHLIKLFHHIVLLKT